MIPDKIQEILKHEGVVAIATQGKNGPHLVNTWNSYVQVSETGSLLVPVGGMQETQENLHKDNRVLVTLGSREITGLQGPGAGFLITGTAQITNSGNLYDLVHKKFPWARAVLEINIHSAEQTI